MDPVAELLRLAFSLLVGAQPLGEPASLDPMRPPDSIDNCHELLDAAGAKYEPSRIPLHEARAGGFSCGTPQAVRYRGSAEKIRYSSKPKVSCAVALALPRFEAIVREEAADILDARVHRIEHLGTYNCREMAAYEGWVSEHSYANAIDIAAFVLSDGTRISVLEHWSDSGPKGRFLRRVARRSFDESVFAGVLTPDFDAHHRNHFHLDMAHYRSDGAGPG